MTEQTDMGELRELIADIDELCTAYAFYRKNAPADAPLDSVSLDAQSAVLRRVTRAAPAFKRLAARLEKLEAVAEAVGEAVTDQSNGCDVLASASWDEVVRRYEALKGG